MHIYTYIHHVFIYLYIYYIFPNSVYDYVVYNL